MKMKTIAALLVLSGLLFAPLACTDSLRETTARSESWNHSINHEETKETNESSSLNLNKQLFTACKLGKSDKIMPLLQQGAEATWIGEDGMNAIMIGASNTKLLTCLIPILARHKKDITVLEMESTDEEGMTAFLIAARAGNLSAVKALIFA